MFKAFYLFELQYRAKRPATWLYVFIMFLLGFLLIASGGISGSEKTNFNSALTIAQVLAISSVFGGLIASAIMGVPVYRDLEHRTQNFLFAYPINEKKYLLGKYLGSLTVLALVPIGTVLGMWLGSILGPIFDWVEPDRFGPTVFRNYFQPLLIFGLINYFFTGTLFFALVAKTRKIMAAYMGSILFLLLYLIVDTLASDLENRKFTMFFDPFAINVLFEDFRYLTPAEVNTQGLTISKNLLINRLIFSGLTTLILLWVYLSFSFKQFFIIKQKIKKKIAQVKVPSLDVLRRPVEKTFGLMQNFKLAVSLWKIETLSIFRDRFFWVMMLGGLITLAMNNSFANYSYGTAGLPLTYNMLEGRENNFVLFVWVMLLFYTGEVVHRNKSLNFSGIFDSLPVPSWVSYIAKVKAIAVLAFTLAASVMVMGILNQLFKGFTDINLPMYLKEVVFVIFPEYLQIVLLAFFVHVLVNSKFLGHFVGIGVWVLIFVIKLIAKTDYNLFFYGNSPSYTLSDFSGYGHFAEPLLYYTLYWLAVGLVLLAIGYFFWLRGAEESFKARWQNAKAQMNLKSSLVIVIPMIAALGLGGFIFYNTSVLNLHVRSKKSLDERADYERSYKQYKDIPQPTYTAVKLEVDLFPEERKYFSSYQAQLVNKTSAAIDTLFFTLSNYRGAILVDNKALELVYQSREFINTNDAGSGFKGISGTRFVKFKLPKTLAPGDTLNCTITDTTEIRGFGNSDINWRINENGSFLDLVPPSFGYNEDFEISSDAERKKRDLPFKSGDLPLPTDQKAVNTNLFNPSADLVQFEAIVSTSSDQIAIAPGKLLKEWTTDNRKYFHYKSEEPITLFYSVVSGRYALLEEVVEIDGRKIPMKIYHNPKHKYNLVHFMGGLRDALVYNSKNFSPYQHNEIRIIEFPRYAGFAQSFPNTIPFSEGFAWTADFSDPNSYNSAYYVTAHEVGHQWWGHQAMPSKTRGANLVSESLAEYSAIMVAEHKYGAENLRTFLEYSLDGYLRGRANESKKETNYIDCTQGYQWYQKGSLIFYATKDYIGEEVLNSGLKTFVNQFAFKSPPYPTSYNLFDAVKAVTPDSMHYFLEESWKKITLYDNRVKSVDVKSLDNGKFEVNMVLQVGKFYADSTGLLTDGNWHNDQIDVALLLPETKDENGKKQVKTIYLNKHGFNKNGEHKIQLVVDKKPVKVGIDPFSKLIDRNSDDNLLAVE